MNSETPQNFRDLGVSASTICGLLKITTNPTSDAALTTTTTSASSTTIRDGTEETATSTDGGTVPPLPPLAGFLPAPGAILRCGAIPPGSMDREYWTSVGSPRAILDLRADDAGDSDIFHPSGCTDKTEEKGFPKPKLLHEATEDKTERYFTANNDVRKWIISALRHLEDSSNFPLMIHCRAGRDRTGIICAAILLLVGCPPEVALKEYELSDTPKTDKFLETLKGFGVSLGAAGGTGGSSSSGSNATPETGVGKKKSSTQKSKIHSNSQRAKGGKSIDELSPSSSPAAAMERYLRGGVNLEKVRHNLLFFGSSSGANGRKKPQDMEEDE